MKQNLAQPFRAKPIDVYVLRKRARLHEDLRRFVAMKADDAMAEVSMPVQERLRVEIDEALEQFRAVMVEG